eukprot:c8538_g2_i2.p2 GENE.c8538_g2_i2~~c8538_g2_i2.p2  ORF type:complete len:167 (+),score=22.19 c8538_g2_i2:39-539(+)
MLRAFVLSACIVFALAADGVTGTTPTLAQTGELRENQRFLFAATDTKCARHVICKSCVEDITCGWCATSGLCYEGNVLGAFKANCSMWEFAWCSGEPCNEHATCLACSSDPLCGWCQSTQSCTEGGEQGPMFGDCHADQWFHKSCAGASSSLGMANIQESAPESVE